MAEEDNSFTDKQRENSEATARRLANLKPFKPGQSGNPKGRPKTITLSEAYRRELAKVDEADPQKRTYAELLAERMREKAMQGDGAALVAMLKEVGDRTEGKAKQTIVLTADRREQLETSIQRILEQAASEGDEMTREEAINELAAAGVPDVRSLLVN